MEGGAVVALLSEDERTQPPRRYTVKPITARNAAGNIESRAHTQRLLRFAVGFEIVAHGACLTETIPGNQPRMLAPVRRPDSRVHPGGPLTSPIGWIAAHPHACLGHTLIVSVGTDKRGH